MTLLRRSWRLWELKKMLKGELKQKTTRTVHGDKVVRLRIDVPYSEFDGEGDENQDLQKWLEVRVGRMVNMEFSDFVDEKQIQLDEA